MNEPVKKTITPVQVACEVCLKEVPHSDTQYEEAGDYVLYFCGLECYKIWREQDEKEQP
jgi:hypothetical protein